MRRLINWVTVFLSFAFLILGLSMSGCSGGAGAADERDPAVSGMLRPVRDADELARSLKSGISTLAQADAAPSPSPSANGTPGQFSGTYTQELAVDELDTVRYDGSHLYIAPQRHVHCCLATLPAGASGAAAAPPAPDRAIRILRTDTAAASATVVASIPLDDDRSVQGMYIESDRLIALTSAAFWGEFGIAWDIAGPWAPADFGIELFDVADPAAPAKVFSAKIDGVFVASRRIGDRVFIVSRYMPTQALASAERATISLLPLDALLPKITIEGSSRPLFDARQCFVNDEDTSETRGYPVITSVTVFSVNDPRSSSSICYNELTSGVYVSESSLYLAEPRITDAPARALTRIHKFSLSGALPGYVGSVEVAGSIWTHGQRDFRISEHQGLLRVMTTEYPEDSSDNRDHRLFVLRERAGEKALEIVSQLPNERHPDEIGKPGEELYGVRFLGDRAFAVTFRTIDPLYVFDLADPANPRIAAEMDLPGFSDFLHPVTDALLLGLGTSSSGALKLELFDVSSLEQPLSRGVITLGGPWSSSEALADRHAFTYLPDVAGVDRFAIPAVLTHEADSTQYPQAGLYLFEISAKQTPASATLQRAGAIIPRPSGQSLPISFQNRSFIHGDTVFFVSAGEVWSAQWRTPDLVNGPY